MGSIRWTATGRRSIKRHLAFNAFSDPNKISDVVRRVQVTITFDVLLLSRQYRSLNQTAGAEWFRYSECLIHLVEDT